MNNIISELQKRARGLYYGVASMAGKEDEMSLNRFELSAVLGLMATLSECTTLKSKEEIQAAAFLIKKLGLPCHNDYQKNWDTLKALYYVLQITQPSSNILDAGGGVHSPVLNALAALGYLSLYACDVVDVTYVPERFSDTIRFSVQNIERTNYPDQFFDAVTCLSVIEHGVDHQRFFQEIKRIIKVGGVVLLTADYWPEYIDCTGIFPYGPQNPEMKVYHSGDVMQLVEVGKTYGFELCSPLKLDACEKAVRWDNVDREYTFIFIALVRKNSSPGVLKEKQ